MDTQAWDGLQGTYIHLLALGALWVIGASGNEGCEVANTVDMVIRLQQAATEFMEVEPAIGRSLYCPVVEVEPVNVDVGFHGNYDCGAVLSERPRSQPPKQLGESITLWAKGLGASSPFRQASHPILSPLPLACQDLFTVALAVGPGGASRRAVTAIGPTLIKLPREEPLRLVEQGQGTKALLAPKAAARTLDRLLRKGSRIASPAHLFGDCYAGRQEPRRVPPSVLR